MVFQNYALFPAHERAQEHRLRPRHAPSAEGGDRAQGRRGDRHGAARRPGGEAAGPALGRPAAARRDRARDRRRTAAGADGRAAVEPRRQAEARDARRDSPHPQRARGDDDLRHARSGGGAVARRPDCRDARGPGAPDRRAAATSTPGPTTSTSPNSWASATASPARSSRSRGAQAAVDVGGAIVKGLARTPMRVGETVRLAARPDDVSLAEVDTGAAPATVASAEFHGHGFMCGAAGPEGSELWFRAPREARRRRKGPSRVRSRQRRSSSAPKRSAAR